MDSKVHAEQILNNPLFKKLVAEYKAKLFSDWCGAETLEERESIHIKVNAVQEFASELTENLMRINNE